MRLAPMTTDDGRIYRHEVHTFADYLLAELEPERQVGSMADGNGWIGDYGDGRVIAMDYLGFATYFKVTDALNVNGDEDDMRHVANLMGWPWWQLFVTTSTAAHLICDECTNWAANADDSSHDLMCDCSTDEPCDMRQARYATFRSDDYPDHDSHGNSELGRCFGCGADEFMNNFIVRSY